MDDASIARFQGDLVRLLHEGVNGDALRRKIRDRHGEAFAAWVDAFDPRAEHVATLIVRRWAREAGCDS